jgi:hypothetical protein
VTPVACSANVQSFLLSENPTGLSCVAASGIFAMGAAIGGAYFSYCDLAHKWQWWNVAGTMTQVVLYGGELTPSVCHCGPCLYAA